MATAPAAQPKRIKTKVEIERDDGKPDGVDFKFPGVFGGTHKQKYENDHFPGFIIDFEIKDKDNTGLLFPKEQARAMWVHTVDDEHGPCPPEGATWSQFFVLDVLDGGKTLSVRNLNQDPQLFKFSLNFTRERDDPNGKLVCWDPIGDNRNGLRMPSTPSAGLLVGVAIGAGVAGAAAGYLACSKSNRRG